MIIAFSKHELKILAETEVPPGFAPRATVVATISRAAVQEVGPRVIAAMAVADRLAQVAEIFAKHNETYDNMEGPLAQDWDHEDMENYINQLRDPAIDLDVILRTFDYYLGELSRSFATNKTEGDIE